MTPRQFLEAVVRPNMDALNADTGDFRAAFNAAVSIDALSARIYRWLESEQPALVGFIEREDDGYRDHLAEQNFDYRLLCDVARAMKHCELRRKTPRLVYSASKVSPQTLMVSDMESFDRDWTTTPCVLIERDGERPLIARNVFERALEFLENRMAEVGAI